MIFITDGSSGNELALEVKDLDTAELDFVLTFGLTSELAAALRGSRLGNDTAENLIALCAKCHQHAHRHRNVSRNSRIRAIGL